VYTRTFRERGRRGEEIRNSTDIGNSVASLIERDAVYLVNQKSKIGYEKYLQIQQFNK
jgi:hypothetical protein